MALENGSVVFVSHDVSNVTIGQDRNQIIVIPIDYYKSQNNVQNRMEIDDSQKRDFYHSKEIVEEEKNTVIFEGVVLF